MNRVVQTSMAVGIILITGCRATMPQAPDSNRAAKVVALAKQMIGKPYRYGGRSPLGFDCSGLVYYVFQQALGKQTPRTSQGLYASSTPVPLGQEQPSDLLFFRDSGNNISHVGIYIGQGQFVHAASTGKVVRQSNGNQKYWRRRFAGVRRIIR